MRRRRRWRSAARPRPSCRPATVDATEAAIQKYQDIVARGGWNQAPAGAELRVGSKSKAVEALRERLVASGDLDPVAGMGPVSIPSSRRRSSVSRPATASSQTGVVNEATFAELNVPAEARLQQLQTNIVRLKAYAGDLGARYVVANIPAASVETVEDGVVYSHHAAGVGKIDRQSPIMQTKATEINFNPFWTVPPSLIKKDLIPKMKADPNYLTEEKIRIFNKDGQEVSPASINWNTNEATNYKYRQDTGADLNSLGFVRINIPNPYGVYMHDTPSKGIFGDDFRFVSSGCVRVQDVRDYVAWLLKDNPGWGRDQIDAVIRSGRPVDVKLTQPVNVYWVYITAWATRTASSSSAPTSISATARAQARLPRPSRPSRWRCRRNKSESPQALRISLRAEPDPRSGRGFPRVRGLRAHQRCQARSSAR